MVEVGRVFELVGRDVIRCGRRWDEMLVYIRMGELEKSVNAFSRNEEMK